MVYTEVQYASKSKCVFSFAIAIAVITAEPKDKFFFELFLKFITLPVLFRIADMQFSPLYVHVSMQPWGLLYVTIILDKVLEKYRGAPHQKIDYSLFFKYSSICSL